MTENIIAVTDASAAGSITYWRLKGVVNLRTLREAWAAARLPESLLPGDPSPQAALRRAVREVSDTRRLARPLAKRGGYAVVDESATENELTYKVGLKAKLVNGQNGTAPHVEVEPADHPLADSIRAAFKLAETEVPSDVIGLWLAQKVMPALNAVPLRDSGGVYFVPKDQQIALNLIAKVLEASSGHALHRIPAMRSADAVAAILDAIQAEAEKESAQLEADALSDDLGPRAFRGRIKVADALRAKVESYETLLGSNLDALKERIEKLRAALTIAEVRAASDDATA